MANSVIQLKWSNLTDVPASLNVGEPAYSNTSHKLFIGDSANNAIAIGGKYYVDQQGQIFAKINAAFDVANTAMVFTTSITAPVNPTIGDIWYYTTDDVIYQYVNDGTTSYWIDIQTPTLSSNGAELPLIANTTATSASIYANSAFSKANNALANTTGTFAGDLTVTGNVTATGSILAVPAWTSAGAITLTAITTNPTKGTTTSDNISYRQLGAKQWEVVITYFQSVGNGGGGSGDYLITLPNGLSFDTTLPSQPLYTGNAGASTFAHLAYIIPTGNGTITNNVVGGHTYPMVYSATKFRILTITYGSGIQPWSSGFYSTGDIPKIQLSFRFTST